MRVKEILQFSFGTTTFTLLLIVDYHLISFRYFIIYLKKQTNKQFNNKKHTMYGLWFLCLHFS